ncbi:radical SAM family heme chaperone HemW [Robiginitalea aurantiaca]|uniref:Heme chaperone HemW n=1 Tax=Robiginitalea aurantiaca TaxID=3056915 RepID=A0ABT7WBQ7_9FLAO|nr:radical SAM family heme chaperone HemW [Robiginitalea aurantiaca]MDM9630349.1 radical SAM family heme chaperone HemW [Robiginitalea aurantiaca]
MSGIYFHIPFCKQACHYCNFHFSTSLKHKDAVLQAMKKELHHYAREGWQGPLKTLYFGGGTPSILTVEEIEHFIELARQLYGLTPGAEITLEANPDDLNDDKLRELAKSPVNRLSLGIQSFNAKELTWMNRAHTPQQALESLELTAHLFENYSLDLIYGIPGSSMQQWAANLNEALRFNPPHISAYALTVEPRTALRSFIDKGVSDDVDEGATQEQFNHLVDTLTDLGYDHYETSNFARNGFYSRNNSAYWQGEYYLGIGPAAHSFDGARRWWNPSNNLSYVRTLEKGELPAEVEELTIRDRYNEAVMTGLRSRWGVSLEKIREQFGEVYQAYLLEQAAPYLRDQFLFLDEETLYTAGKGKFLADGIASDLFMINLK